MREHSRLIWLDALRLIAGVSMVGLHATADPTGQPFPDATPPERLIPLLIRVVVYTARTELFIIISLFLLLMALDRRPRGYGETIREQTARLLVPFLFWTLFFAFWNLIKANSFGYLPSAIAEMRSPAAWAEYLLLGAVKYHMHFIPTLFALVLAYPLFRLAVANPWLGLILIPSLLIKREADLFIWSELQWLGGFDYLVRGIKLFTYLGYGMAAGACLGLYRMRPTGTVARQWVSVVVYLGLGLFLIKLIYTYRVALAGDWQYNYTPAYWADFIMPVILFLTCMLLADRKWPALLSQLAPYSFGIYLTHPIFMDLAEIGLAGLALHPGPFVLTKIIFVLLATSGFVWVIGRWQAMAWTIGLGPRPRFDPGRLIPYRRPTIRSPKP